jgi:hypothetical protein
MDRCDVVVVGGPARQGKAAMRQGKAMASRNRVGAARVSDRVQCRSGNEVQYAVV